MRYENDCYTGLRCSRYILLTVKENEEHDGEDCNLLTGDGGAGCSFGACDKLGQHGNLDDQGQQAAGEAGEKSLRKALVMVIGRRRGK